MKVIYAFFFQAALTIINRATMNIIEIKAVYVVTLIKPVIQLVMLPEVELFRMGANTLVTAITPIAIVNTFSTTSIY